MQVASKKVYWKVSKYLFFLTKEMYIKLKLTNYNVMIKIGKQDLTDIIDIKKYKSKPYNLSTKVL